MSGTPEITQKRAAGAVSRWMGTSRSLTLLGASLTAIVFLLVVASLVRGMLTLEPVFAMGDAQIVARGPSIRVVFTSARTDDPRRRKDPGLDQHVGRCEVRARERERVSLAIVNGYPGYTCTLRIIIKNRGREAAHLQALDYDVPEELIVTGPQYPSGLTLRPRQREVQIFTIQVGPEAEEGTRYTFSVRQWFQ